MTRATSGVDNLQIRSLDDLGDVDVQLGVDEANHQIPVLLRLLHTYLPICLDEGDALLVRLRGSQLVPEKLRLRGNGSHTTRERGESCAHLVCVRQHLEDEGVDIIEDEMIRLLCEIRRGNRRGALGLQLLNTLLQRGDVLRTASDLLTVSTNTKDHLISRKNVVCNLVVTTLPLVQLTLQRLHALLVLRLQQIQF